MHDDEITKSLLNLKSDLPKPRLNLSEKEKEELVAKLGLGSVKSILKAKKTLPLKRIPFLFSSLDTQAVVDVLANDMESVVSAK